ncbi:MAG: VTT domain-containing protein [Clostridiales bacterium]|nr:VTT domain-containing protein [Clostridiales bacterium]MCF8022295.1 VTT domain-containing protein [Clostridiales bacterium]
MFAIITIAVSVIGATLGYWLGLKGGRPLLFKFFSQDKIQKGENLIQTHGIMAVLITSFTPIPYKLITVSSGVLGLSLKKLIFWSTIGRGARFFLEAVLIMVYGRAVKDFLLGSTFSFFTLVIGIISLIIYFLYIIRKRKT